MSSCNDWKMHLINAGFYVSIDIVCLQHPQTVSCLEAWLFYTIYRQGGCGCVFYFRSQAMIDIPVFFL